MTMDPSEARARLLTIADAVTTGRVIPVLGPDVLAVLPEPPPFPTGARDLSHYLASRVPVSGRLRNNLWHTAQFIESRRHRVTVDKLMAEVFAPVPEPGLLHHWLAEQTAIPMIIDTWYDGTMAKAMSRRNDWGLIQGASKARRLVETPWTRAYDAQGAECPEALAEGWKTILYKPHGAAHPVGDVLISDSDYVEVLTEIDIQSPLPPSLKERRQGRSFLFLGCRFYDQILRSFARSFMKCSGAGHAAVVPMEGLTRNELKFFADAGVTALPLPLSEAIAILTGTETVSHPPREVVHG